MWYTRSAWAIEWIQLLWIVKASQTWPWISQCRQAGSFSSLPLWCFTACMAQYQWVDINWASYRGTRSCASFPCCVFMLPEQQMKVQHYSPAISIADKTTLKSGQQTKHHPRIWGNWMMWFLIKACMSILLWQTMLHLTGKRCTIM